MRRLAQLHRRSPLAGRVIQQPYLVTAATTARQMLNSPELLGTGSAKAVERSNPRQQFQFLAGGTDPLAEILQRNELAALALREDALLRSFSQSLHPHRRYADPAVAHNKARTRVIDPRRKKRDPQAVAFEDVHQRPVEALAVRQYCPHKLRG